MSTAAHYEPYINKRPRSAREQQRWPTIGWAVGELRWYLIGGIAGAGVATAAFATWIVLTQTGAL